MDFGIGTTFAYHHPLASDPKSILHPSREDYKSNVLWLLVEGIFNLISSLFSSITNPKPSIEESSTDTFITGGEEKHFKHSGITPEESNTHVGNTGVEEKHFRDLGITPPSDVQLGTDIGRAKFTLEGNQSLQLDNIDNLKEAVKGFEVPQENLDYLRSSLNQAILSEHNQHVRAQFENMYPKQIQGSILFSINITEKTVTQETNYTIHILDHHKTPVLDVVEKKVKVISVSDFSKGDPMFKIHSKIMQS